MEMRACVVVAAVAICISTPGALPFSEEGGEGNTTDGHRIHLNNRQKDLRLELHPDTAAFLSLFKHEEDASSKGRQPPGSAQDNVQASPGSSSYQDHSIGTAGLICVSVVMFLVILAFFGLMTYTVIKCMTPRTEVQNCTNAGLCIPQVPYKHI